MPRAAVSWETHGGDALSREEPCGCSCLGVLVTSLQMDLSIYVYIHILAYAVVSRGSCGKSGEASSPHYLPIGMASVHFMVPSGGVEVCLVRVCEAVVFRVE